VQRKTEQDKATAEAAQHESKLQAELQAARDALQQAEVAKRKSDLDRVAAESAQREARLQGELKAAKDALQLAEQSGKKADLESKNATAALRLAEQASRTGAELDKKGARGASPKALAAPQAASKTESAAVGSGSARYDGNYQGRFCNVNEGKAGATRCWNVLLTVQDGKVFSTWPSRYSEHLVHAKGTIAPDGSISLAIDGYRPDGQALRATVLGSWAADKITLSGSWRNGVGLDASVTRVR